MVLSPSIPPSPVTWGYPRHAGEKEKPIRTAKKTQGQSKALWMKEVCVAQMDAMEFMIAAKEEDILSETHHFRLLEPLRALQRKSYERETRYIQPKPAICVHKWSVSCRLADEQGSPLSAMEQDQLAGLHGKEFTFVPCIRTPPLHFLIKSSMLHAKVCLRFEIDYELDSGEREEVPAPDCDGASIHLYRDISKTL
ncbi:hypothetical protein PROFUN_02158 [Planoprotostelium fungivorum]|uniref:Uncharacterized protein n=1 Tax=Planoprotostelium fungivorum TaxID=1890364 RepID=A0A2P6NZA8_9EUKA|nr:hypothetical protein PROFUN_02158 [Planoprotostelium fungivorum]